MKAQPEMFKTATNSFIKSNHSSLMTSYVSSKTTIPDDLDTIATDLTSNNEKYLSGTPFSILRRR